jgi:hypothetical protein
MGCAGLEKFTKIKPIICRLGKCEPYFGLGSSR